MSSSGIQGGNREEGIGGADWPSPRSGAGADLDTGFVGGEESNRDHRDGGGRVTMAINRCRKPTIGALNGSAVGVGITMTLPMNIRIAYQDAKIGFVFARRGLVMEAASSFFLPRLIG